MFFNHLKMVLGKVFQLSETSINSYDISFMYRLPWYNCHVVECGIKHHTSNPLFTKAYTYLPIYLHFYQNYRFYSIFASYFHILKEVSLGVIMTNTEIFHIFHSISLFNLPFFHIFHIFSLFNLFFFHIFHIISHFNFSLFDLLFFISYSLTYTTHSMIFPT